MNAQLISRALLAAALLSGTAQATDGTINFTGTLTSSTCTVSVNGGSDVTLPTLSTDALTDAGSWAGRTPFTVRLTSCSDAGNVGLYFEQTGETDTTNNALNNTASGSAADHVQIQLLNSNLVTIDLSGSSLADQNSLSQDASSGSADIQLYAQYFSKDGGATAGAVTAQAVFSLNYQ